MRSMRSSRIVHVFFARTESLQSATVSSVLVEFAEDGNGECLSVMHGFCGLMVNKRWSSAH